MVQNHTWKRRNQGNSSTKEITIKIDASCHVEIPISIYLSKSSAASDISIIGADWVHPTLMRINSGTSWGMGTAAIRGTSLTTFQPLFSREKAGFSQVCCQREVGGEDRVITWISPGIQRGCGGGASCPEPDSAAGMGFRPLGTMVKEGYLLLPGVPAHCPAHLQVIHQEGRHQLGQECDRIMHHNRFLSSSSRH